MTITPAAVIDRVTLVVSDLDQAEDDYVTTFGCRVEQRGDIEPSLTSVLCIRQARGRRSLLRLGRERIELLEFTDLAGRPYPPDSTSTDLWFQHMAIVVNDMVDAHRRVMINRRFRPITRGGPVRLILRVRIRVQHRNSHREPRARTSRSRRRGRRVRQRHPARARSARTATGTAPLPRGYTTADPARHSQQRHRGDTQRGTGRLA